MAEKLNTRTSIVDYLKSQGQDSSMSARKQIAQQHGISNYTGTYNQNVQLLSTLRGSGVSGSSSAPAPSSQPSVSRNTSSIPSLQQISPPPVPDIPDVPNRSSSRVDDAVRNYESSLSDTSRAFYENQEAMLDSSREQRINELRKAYDRAVLDGEMSERDADEQFRDNVDAINTGAYRDNQIVDLNAQSRGIQNSQQMLAMQQGAQRHTASLRDENRQIRDRRINDIRDRIGQITNEYNLDVSETNVLHRNQLAQAQAQSDMMYSQGMTNLNMAQYQSAQEMQNALTMLDEQTRYQMQMMAQQYGYDLNKMSVQQQYQLAQMAQNQIYTQQNMATQQSYTQQNMATQQSYTQDNMRLQHGMDLSKMKTAHGYDLKKMDKQYNIDLSKMAKQQGYDMAKINQQQKHAMSQIDAQRRDRVKEAEAMYAMELERLNSAYNDKSSTEYKVRVAQLNDAESREINSIVQHSMLESMSAIVNPGSVAAQMFYDNPMDALNTQWGLGNSQLLDLYNRTPQTNYPESLGRDMAKWLDSDAGRNSEYTVK